MARKTKEQNAAEAAIQAAWGKALQFKQIPVMKLGAIKAEIEAAYAAGKREAELEAAAEEAAAKYAA